MGAKPKVTEKVYNQIKKELITPKDDQKVMKKYNIGQTTARAIRRSPSYVCFLTRTRRVTFENAVKESEGKTPDVKKDRASVAVDIFTVITYIALSIGVVLLIAWAMLRLFGA